jgi:hypothetical protein
MDAEIYCEGSTYLTEGLNEMKDPHHDDDDDDDDNDGNDYADVAYNRIFIIIGIFLKE